MNLEMAFYSVRPEFVAGRAEKRGVRPDTVVILSLVGSGMFLLGQVPFSLSPSVFAL